METESVKPPNPLALAGSLKINLNDACAFTAFEEYLTRRLKAPCKVTAAKQAGNGNYDSSWEVTFTQEPAGPST